MELTLLYPNTSKNVIRFKGKIRSGSFHLIDASGKIYVEGPLTDNTVNINSLCPGTYFINVFSGQKLLKTFKVCKK